MNVVVVYFSQSGNTRRVAERMAGVFREAGHDTRTVSLKKASPQDVVAADLLGIGTPCFSGRAPAPVKAFLQNLPLLDNKRAFVFATSGGAPARVLYDLTRLLQSQGADIAGGFLTRGELHHPAPCMRGRMPNRPDAHDFAQVQRFAGAVIEHVSAGRPGPVAESRPDAFKPRGGFYDLVASISTDGIVRLALPKPKLDPARCNQCRWCVYECPMDNITLQPYPSLGDECIRCYRCLTGCPQQAFGANWWLGNLVTLALYNTAFVRWFGDLEPGEHIY